MPSAACMACEAPPPPTHLIDIGDPDSCPLTGPLTELVTVRHKPPPRTIRQQPATHCVMVSCMPPG